ncbi:hypothetical protein [Actinomadura fibrosa]
MLGLGAWLIIRMVTEAMRYLIAKAAINKTDARDLHKVLHALAPWLARTARSDELPRPVPNQLADPAASAVQPPQDGDQTPRSEGGTQ